MKNKISLILILLFASSVGVASYVIPNLGVTTAKIAALAVTTAKIADSNVTTAKIADANVTQAKRAALGEQLSGGTGSGLSTTSGTYSDITGTSVTIVTTGRPVFITLGGDTGSANPFYLELKAAASTTVMAGYIRLLRDGSQLKEFFFNKNMETGAASSIAVMDWGSPLIVIDNSSTGLTAGSHVYKWQFKAATNSSMGVNSANNTAFEL